MTDGADDSFLRSIDPFRDGLRLHCYRMLGSSSDGDDVMQEVLLRAWRAKGALSDASLLRPWLYRIATNACLDELKERPRRALSSDAFPAQADPRKGPAPFLDEPLWLEPMPDTWLAGVPELDPSARVTLKESVALAFMAALHALSAVQRATLLLRDVIGFSAEETAGALAISVSAANSALFRARSAIDEKLGGRALANPPEVDEALLARYVKAWESADIQALVALFRDEIVTTMPPSPTWIGGREANFAFYDHMFAIHEPKAPARILRTRANGQPALAYYRRSAVDAPFTLRAVQVLDLRGGAIARIDHFLIPAVLPLFGLPVAIAD